MSLQVSPHELENIPSRDAHPYMYVSDNNKDVDTLGEYEVVPHHIIHEHELPFTTLDDPLLPTKQTKWKKVPRPQSLILMEEETNINKVGQKQERHYIMDGVGGESDKKKLIVWRTSLLPLQQRWLLQSSFAKHNDHP